MQIYNKYFNLPNYFAFFCRLHPTEPIGISGFYAPPYKIFLMFYNIRTHTHLPPPTRTDTTQIQNVLTYLFG